MNSDVLVKFKGDTKDLDKKTKEAKSSLNSFAKTATKVLGTGLVAAASAATAAIAAVGSKIVDITKQSVEAYSMFEQLEGGLVSLFGEGSAEMQQILEDSKKAYETLTMSQNDYLNNFQKSYPLVNAGLSENANAIEYTNKVLQLSSDLFNTYGGDVEYYQSAINWALKGSFVYLDNLNLGIKGTSEGFIDAANKSGILGREIRDIKELTNDEIIDVIQHYAEAYGVWGKTAEEASKTITGSMNMTKAAWDNFILGLSQKDADIDGLIQNVVDSAMKFADNITPVIMRALTGIANALPTIATKLAELLPSLIENLLPPLIDAAVNLVRSLAQNLPNIISTLADAIIEISEQATILLPEILDALMKAMVAIINALAKGLPKFLPILIDALVKGIVAITDNLPLIIEAGIELLLGLVEALPTVIEALVNALPDLITSIITVFIDSLPLLIDASIKLFMALIEALPYIIAALVDSLPKIINTIINVLTNNETLQKIWDTGKTLFFNILNGLTAFFGKIWDAGKDLVMGLWNGINDKVGWIVDKVKGFGKSVMKAIKNIFGIHSPSTEFEWVGKMNIEGLEKGMEEMKPQLQRTLNGVFDLQPSVSGTMNSTYSPQMNVVVNNSMEFDPLGQLVSNIKTFSGGAKNDYNWGATK